MMANERMHADIHWVPTECILPNETHWRYQTWLRSCKYHRPCEARHGAGNVRGCFPCATDNVSGMLPAGSTRCTMVTATASNYSNSYQQLNCQQTSVVICPSFTMYRRSHCVSNCGVPTAHAHGSARRNRTSGSLGPCSQCHSYCHALLGMQRLPHLHTATLASCHISVSLGGSCVLVLGTLHTSPNPCATAIHVGPGISVTECGCGTEGSVHCSVGA